MPTQVTCPSCGGPLRVPEELFGKRVQCPTCQAIFVAEYADGGAGPAPARPAVGHDYDDAPPPRRKWLQPNRGSTVLTLGILSLVLCSPLGVAAWVMGNTDLEAMRRGEMDPTGEGLTQAGRICGMIGTARFALECLGGALYVLGMIALGAHHRF